MLTNRPRSPLPYGDLAEERHGQPGRGGQRTVAQLRPRQMRQQWEQVIGIAQRHVHFTAAFIRMSRHFDGIISNL